MNAQTFCTITDKDTEYTNSRSKRMTFDEAVEEAQRRISSNPRHPGVFILQAVAIVKPKPVDVVVERITVEKI